VLIAGQLEAALTLVHVVDDDQPPHLADAQRMGASELLGQTARTITEVDRIAADAVVTTGDAFAGILATAEETEPDLIVVGPHRRQFLDVFVGTTAERTIRRSRRPVLMANTVPSGSYQRILVAVDFDDASRAAVEGVDRLGLLDRTEVIALHLFEAPALGMLKRAMDTPQAIDHYVGTEERRAAADLEPFLSEVGLARSRRLLRPDRGGAAGAILSCAEEQKADLVVVGTRQRKGVERFLLGSVAGEVLREAKPDVLVVPATMEAGEAAR
jgi:nucleotide-binding universal stress UspA family protein